MLEEEDLPGALEALGAHVLKMAERFRFEDFSQRSPVGRGARFPNPVRVGPLPD